MEEYAPCCTNAHVDVDDCFFFQVDVNINVNELLLLELLVL